MLFGGVPHQSNEEIANAISHMTPAEVEAFWKKAGSRKRQKVGGWLCGWICEWVTVQQALPLTIQTHDDRPGRVRSSSILDFGRVPPFSESPTHSHLTAANPDNNAV